MLFGVMGGVLLLVMAAVASRKAWLTTLEMWPLDTQFPDYLQDAAPVRGKWLALALRMLTFPVVLFAYASLGLVLVVVLLILLSWIIGLNMFA